MMDQNEVDVIAFAMVNKELRRVAKEAAVQAMANVDVRAIVAQTGLPEGDLFDALVESAELVQGGGVCYISIADANEIRWERETESVSPDAMTVKYSD